MDLTDAYAPMLADFPAIFSLTLVAAVGLIIILVDSFRNNDPSIPWMAGTAVAVAMVWEGFMLGSETGAAFYGAVRTGGFASFVNLMILGSALISIFFTVPYLRRIDRNYGEIYALLLFATAGMIMLGTANNLISVFIGLETMSICLYIFTGFIREDPGAVEAALKYFLLGAFATGFFLYGIALIYGATGTIYLPEIAAGLAETGSEMLFWGGVGLLFVGFMFKVSAAPFHMWTPDVYQGAPTALVAYMSTATKAAVFAAIVMVLYFALPVDAVPVERWTTVMAVIAVITMMVGNVLALAQTNVKRLLAYSWIAHAGYVFVGLASGTAAGYAGVMYYLLVYSVMNIGAFGVMVFLEWDGKEGRIQTLNSLAGIGYRRPVLGTTMGFFMFSLTGLPPLAGFTGKYFVFAPAIDAGLTWLVIIAVLASIISAYYYLRVVYVFWMQSPEETPEAQEIQDRTFPVPVASEAALVACAVGLLVLFVFAGSIMGFTHTMFEEAAQMASHP